MKPCKFCGEIIPKACKICPKCMAKQPINEVLKHIVIVFAVIIFVGFVASNSQEENIAQNSSQSDTTENTTEEKKTDTNISEEEYKKLCKEYNYKDVLRNPENYIGEKIVITLEISSVHEKSLSNPTKYYFAYSESEPESGFYFGDRYGVFDKRENTDLKLLKDDVIKVYGEIADPQQTQSIIVMSEELFCIDMKYVELLSE